MLCQAILLFEERAPAAPHLQLEHIRIRATTFVAHRNRRRGDVCRFNVFEFKFVINERVQGCTSSCHFNLSLFLGDPWPSRHPNRPLAQCYHTTPIEEHLHKDKTRVWRPCSRRLRVHHGRRQMGGRPQQRTPRLAWG